MKNFDKRINEQFRGYVLLTVFYVTLMITVQAVGYRLIQIGPFLQPGGIFIFPATFAISDIIAEVYGPTLARRSIVFSLFAQSLFTILPIAVNHLPYPQTWQHVDDYRVVFDSSWVVFISNTSGILVGMILNTQIIGKTKLVMRGRMFSLRSLFSSAIGEFVVTAIVVAVAWLHLVGFRESLHLFFSMFLFKVLFSLIVIYPSSFFVVLFKRIDHVDVYEENITLNPLSKFVKKTRGSKSNVIFPFSSTQK